MANIPESAQLLNQYSAQGSITITRLKNGGSLYLTFKIKNPLYQSADSESGAVNPDWTEAANQPIVTPEVSSSIDGLTITQLDPEWRYNGAVLRFKPTPEADGYRPGVDSSTEDDISHHFAFNPTTNAIKIVKNLASKKTLTDGLLHYGCTPYVNGGRYHICKDLDVILTRHGESGYYGYIEADPGLSLGYELKSTKLTAYLYCDGLPVENYYVKWRKALQEWTAKNGQKSIEVTRGDVDGTRIIVAEFYLNETDETPVAVAGVTVVDTADKFFVRLSVISENQYIDDCHPSVIVKAKIVNKNEVEQKGHIYWRLDVVDQETFTSLKKVDNSDTIEVTTNETDRVKKLEDGTYVLRASDVDVYADATFGLNFAVPVDEISVADLNYRELAQHILSIPLDQFDISKLGTKG